MGTNSLPHLLAGALAVIFAITAIIDLAGSRYIRARFANGGIRAGFTG